MGDYRDYVGGTYLNAADFVGRSQRVTIEFVRPEQIKNGDQTDTKLVARFVKQEKGLVLNKTNLDMLYQLTGETDYEQWAGTMVTLYHDPSVRMNNKPIGGLRLREAQAGPAQPPARVAYPTPPTPPQPRKSVMVENDPTEEAALAVQVYDEDIPF